VVTVLAWDKVLKLPPTARILDRQRHEEFKQSLVGHLARMQERNEDLAGIRSLMDRELSEEEKSEVEQAAEERVKKDAEQVAAKETQDIAAAAALGYDGKWVLHPDQIAVANEIFSPSQEDYDHAELILDAYDWCTSEAGGAKGSAMLGDEMIDEASRKMALVIAGKGRAAGLQRTSKFEPPES